MRAIRKAPAQPLWPGGAPEALGHEAADGRTLTVYMPPAGKSNGAAVVICPGGGYHDLFWELEGEEVVAWLNSQGMAGIILKYRCPRRPGDVKGVPPLGPLLDAQRDASNARDDYARLSDRALAAVRSATAAAIVAAVCAGGFPVIWAAAAKASTAEVAAPPTTAVQPAQRNYAMASELDMAAWSRLGQPDRLIIVRMTSIDVIQHGILEAHTLRAGGTVTIPWLASALGGAAWISMPSPNTAVLSAALLLSRGTSMQVGPDVRRLLLSGGMTRASASWIRCEHASLTISGVALDSLRIGNAAGWRPVPASWAGRPYVYAAAGARLGVLGSTLSDLGEPGSPRRAGPPGSAMKARSLSASWVAAAAGVIWGKGSTGSAVNAQFKRNEVGLRLDGCVGVRLRQVAVENSILDGLGLRGDRATRLRYVVSRSNGGSGVIISGPGPRHLSGLMASANAATGLTAVTQTGLVASAGIVARYVLKPWIWLSGMVASVMGTLSQLMG